MFMTFNHGRFYIQPVLCTLCCSLVGLFDFLTRKTDLEFHCNRNKQCFTITSEFTCTRFIYTVLFIGGIFFVCLSRKNLEFNCNRNKRCFTITLDFTCTSFTYTVLFIGGIFVCLTQKTDLEFNSNRNKLCFTKSINVLSQLSSPSV